MTPEARNQLEEMAGAKVKNWAWNDSTYVEVALWGAETAWEMREAEISDLKRKLETFEESRRSAIDLTKKVITKAVKEEQKRCAAIVDFYCRELYDRSRIKSRILNP